MATRKIKNAKDLVTDELIYFKSHAQATFMSDGTTVEDKINGLQNGGGNLDLSKYVQKTELSSVATSGNYNDLSNKPTIPSAVTESTVSGWGFTKNAGTVTGVKANGTTITLSSGVANIPAASTSAYGVTKLSSATNSTSTSLAATASAVKAAYDLANSYKGTVTSVKINGTTKNPTSGVVDLGTVITSHQDISGKQDKLVSGTNIKTINGTSILGSGNITISGGSGGSSSGSGAYSEVNHGTNDTAFTLTTNTFHVWDEVASLTLDLGSETSGVANEYLFQFTSGSEPTSLILPDDIKWVNGEAPVIEANKIYQISILKGLGSVMSWDNAAALIENKATLIDTTTGEVRFDYPVASDLTVTLRGDMSAPVNFVAGQQSAIADDATMIDPYVIYSISIQSDNTYIYTF